MYNVHACKRLEKRLSVYLCNKCLDMYIVLYYYKDLFTHKDINTYINGVV